MTPAAPTVSAGKRGEEKRCVYCGAMRNCRSVFNAVPFGVMMPRPSEANAETSSVNPPKEIAFSLLYVSLGFPDGWSYKFTVKSDVRFGAEKSACNAKAEYFAGLKNAISENHDDALFSRKKLTPVNEIPALIMSGKPIRKSADAARVPSAR